MQKREFEERIGTQVLDEEYEDIEYVYMWHPAIKEVEGKDQIALLYMNFGLSFIRKMLPLAEKMKGLYDKRKSIEKELSQIEDEIVKRKMEWTGGNA